MESRIRPRHQGRYKTDSMGLGATKKGEIQLNERQLEIKKAREQRNNNKSIQLDPTPRNTSKDIPPSKMFQRDPPAKSPGGQKIATYQDNWGEHPATTAPTTTWESDSAASSSASSSFAGRTKQITVDRSKQFYGQGLTGQAKKLYDDTGASFHESQSEVSSAASSGDPLIRKLTSSGTLEKQGSSDQSTSSYQSRSIQRIASSSSTKSKSAHSLNSCLGQEPKASEALKRSTNYIDAEKASSETSSLSTVSGVHMKKHVQNSTTLGRSESAASKYGSEPGASRTIVEESSPVISVAPAKSQKGSIRELAPAEEVTDENASQSRPQSSSAASGVKITTTTQKSSWKEKAKSKRASIAFGSKRPKSATLPGGEAQNSLLRTLLTTYQSNKKTSKTHGDGDEAASEVSSKSRTKPSRLSFATKKQTGPMSSARSASSSSSTSAKNRAIMKRVVARNFKSNTRKQNEFKSSSAKLKQPISPKSQPSVTSDESANDERSFDDNVRRIRREEAIAKRGQSTSPKRKGLKSPARKTRPSPRNLVENSVSRWSNKATKSPKPLRNGLPEASSESSAGDTASETHSSRSGEDLDNHQVAVDLPKKEESSSATQTFPSNPPEEIKYLSLGADNDLSQRLKNPKKTGPRPPSNVEPNKETGMQLSEMNLLEQQRMMAQEHHTSELPGEDVDIKVSMSSLSRKYGAQSPGIPNVETNRTTPLFSNKTWGNNSEPGGYSEFLETLKCEVASSHSQLWRSFHSLFRGNDRYPHPIVLPGREGVEFDDKTKDMVTNMSSYIKRKYNMVECEPGAQLANDKVVKGQATIQKPFGNYRRDQNRGELGSDKENSSPMIKQTGSSDTIDAENGTDFEVTLGQHVRKSMGTPSTVPLFKARESLVSAPLLNGLGSAIPEEAEVATTQGSIDSKSSKSAVSSIATSCKTPMTSDCCQAPSEDSVYMDQAEGCELKEVVSGLSASKKRRHLEGETRGSETSIPWSGVKLRSVMGSKSDISGSSIPPSWAKVKLRHVAGKEDNNATSGLQPKQEEIIDAENFHRIIVKKPSVERRKQASFLPPTTPLPEDGKGRSVAKPIEIIDVTDTQPEIIDVTEIEHPPCKSPTNKSVRSSQSVSSTDASVIVSLCNDSNSDSQNELKVVVGKKGLIKVEAKPSESKARVIWRLDHDNLKSAMLDISAHKVKLLLENSKGTKDLDFPGLDQCMQFANALHDMTNATEDVEEEPADIKKTDSADSSVFVEQLSDEEQQILEEFRQKKKEAPTKKLKIDAAEEPSKPVSIIEALGNNLSSPVSEISGASSALSSEDSNIAEGYFKMLRMQVPKEAVLHKMEKDKVDPRIISFVLGDRSCSTSDCGSSASVGSLSVKEEKEAASYRKMLKMGVPREAVRHKMKKEGLSSKIINAVLGGEEDTDKPEDSSSEIKLTDAEQSIANSYKKMLKMMVPKEAVQHKMKKEGVDEKIIVSVLGGTLKKQPAIEKSPSFLSDEEESVASSYRQMLKLKISREAVRHKMRLEGIADHIIASVLGEIPKNTPAKPPKKATRVAKGGFHWNPVAESPGRFKNSIWARNNSFAEDTGEGTINISQHVMDHVELFQKRPENENENSSKRKKNSAETKIMARLIDINRANNVAISLKAFKEFDSKQLAQIIEFVDPFQKITGDRALFMRDLLPVPAEVKAIKNYNGEEDRLVPAEIWFQQIAHIKRIDAKVRVMRTIETFKDEAEELGSSFQQLTKACKQVMESQRLPDLLELVRQIGNRMNQGRGEEAVGFKLDFLPRLAQTKGSDRKTTALDLVVNIFIAQNQRECLLLREDLPDCQEASRIQIADLLTEVRNLQGARLKCEKELESLRKEVAKKLKEDAKAAKMTQNPKPNLELLEDSKSESAIPNQKPRKSFRSADTEVRTDVSSMHHELFEKRSKFIDNILKKKVGEDPIQDDKKETETNDEAPSVKGLLEAVKMKTNQKGEKAVSPRKSLQASQSKRRMSLEGDGYTLHSAIARIESFLNSVDEIFPKLETERDLAINTCKELSDFFCEPGGEKSATNLLNTLNEFSTNLTMATKKCDEKQKMEARKKARQSKKPQKPLQKTKPLVSSCPKLSSIPSQSSAGEEMMKKNPSVEVSNEDSGEKKSLVLMVNEMLRTAGDKGVEDFKKGVTYSDANDERLKRIYEAEQKRNFAAEGESDPRSEMLAAIKARSGSIRKGGISAGRDESSVVEEATFADEIPNAFSLEYSTDSSEGHKIRDRSGKSKATTQISEIESGAPKNSRKQSIADRWTRKIDEDEVVDDITADFVVSKKSEEETYLSTEEHDSKMRIQNVGSNDTEEEDMKAERKTRAAYMNRWARPAGTEVPKTPRDLEEESDVGAVMEIKRKTRQRYINRWASKPSDRDDDSESDFIL